MHSSDQPSRNLKSTQKDNIEFERSFNEAEHLLQDIRNRYFQVQTAQQHQAELYQQRYQLKIELGRVKAELEALEVDLESRLFTWSSQKEIFWQAVRFVGLGFVLGQILNACAR